MLKQISWCPTTGVLRITNNNTSQTFTIVSLVSGHFVPWSDRSKPDRSTLNQDRQIILQYILTFSRIFSPPAEARALIVYIPHSLS